MLDFRNVKYLYMLSLLKSGFSIRYPFFNKIYDWKFHCGIPGYGVAPKLNTSYLFKSVHFSGIEFCLFNYPEQNAKTPNI